MGSTICNIVAVCLRAGWMMGVQGRYFKHEGAGDCFVGRACPGNPINSVKFVKLLPRFIRSKENDKIVAEALAEAFPTLAGKGEIDGVLALLLASLAYHYEWLEETLPENSRICSTIPFIKPHFLKNLKKLVVCCYDWDPENFDSLSAKGGSPDHTGMKERAEIKKQQEEMMKKMDAVGEKLDKLPETLETKMEQFCKKMR